MHTLSSSSGSQKENNSLLFCQQKNDTHRIEDDKAGHDVELVQEVVLKTIGFLPATILEPKK